MINLITMIIISNHLKVQLHDAGSVHTLAEVATSDNSQTLQGTHEIQTNEHGHILITGEDGNSEY